MADIYSIISSGYTNAPVRTGPGSGKYVNVDSRLYEGKWTGTYSNKKTFTFSISNVQGFRAKARYQSGSEIKYQDVLIKDNSFRIGDSKFLLKKIGHAQIKTVVTNPATGASTLNTAYADLV